MELEPAALYASGWVARRLGVTPATLRSWHHRYDLGPTGRTEGGHRRYSRADLERLEGICGLTAAGITIGEAARTWSGTTASEPGSAPTPALADQAAVTRTPERHSDGTTSSRKLAAAQRQVARLIATVGALDHVGTAQIINEVLHAYGVTEAWTTIFMPALQIMGDRYALTAGGIHAEHMLSECMRAALSTAAGQCRRTTGTPPVLLAAPDGEQHVLALHAVAAALAELDRPSVLLGASVPPPALDAAIGQLEPRVVFLWSHTSITARQARLPDPGRHPRRPAIVLGGPGWPDRLPVRADLRVKTLAEAVHACVVPDTHPG